MTTIVHLGGVAKLLGIGIVLAGNDAVLVNLFADEGWHGSGVVLKARSSAV